MKEGFRLVHDHSNAAILVLIECQPLYHNLRHDDGVAIKTLIEFNNKDVKLIKNALKINNKWKIKILGVPSWSNTLCQNTFKY